MPPDDFKVVEELKVGMREGRGLYALVRFNSGLFGITRDGKPLVHAGTFEEAQQYFILLVSDKTPRPEGQRRRKSK